MLFPVQQLLEGKDAPVVVKRADKVSAALAVMVKNDYSQLPVVDSAGNLLGMITEQSIISTYYHTGGAVSIFDLTVDNCETSLTPCRRIGISSRRSTCWRAFMQS